MNLDQSCYGIGNSRPSELRLNTFNSFGTAATQIWRFTNKEFLIGSDIDYLDSVANGGTITVKNGGVYAVYLCVSGATSEISAGITLNSANLTSAIDSGGVPTSERLGIVYWNGGSAQEAGPLTWIGYLPVGSVLRAHSNSAVTPASPSFCRLNVIRLG